MVLLWKNGSEWHDVGEEVVMGDTWEIKFIEWESEILIKSTD